MRNFSGVGILNPNSMISPTEQWKLQWERVLRWKKRVEKLKYNGVDNLDFHDVVDVVVAFMQNCYHLKDWVIVSRPDLKKQTYKLLKKSFELKCCQDICNGFKHKEWLGDRKPSVDDDFVILRSYDYFAKVTGSKEQIKYKIDFFNGKESKHYDLFDLTDKCFSTWEDFIKKELT